MILLADSSTYFLKEIWLYLSNSQKWSNCFTYDLLEILFSFIANLQKTNALFVNSNPNQTMLKNVAFKHINRGYLTKINLWESLFCGGINFSKSSDSKKKRQNRTKNKYFFTFTFSTFMEGRKVNAFFKKTFFRLFCLWHDQTSNCEKYLYSLFVIIIYSNNCL